MAKKKDILNERKIAQIIADATNEVFLPAIEEATPKKTGETAKAWRVVIEKNKVYLQNIRFGDIVQFINEGTSGPYVIEPKNAKALRFTTGGNTVFAKRVVHPGIEARKFVQSVLNNSSLRNKFNNLMESKLQAEIDKSNKYIYKI